MQKVTLKPGRVIARSHDEESVVQPRSVLDLLPYLFYSLELDPAFTLGDLFQLIDQEHVGLLGAVLDERILPLIEEARHGSEPDEDTTVEYLRVSNSIEEGQIWRAFDGWGKWPEPAAGSWAERVGLRGEGGIAVELMPLKHLLHLPLRYAPELRFVNDGGSVEYRTTIGITLIEFLKAIFYELTFFGPPERRDAYLAKLDGREQRVSRGEAIPLEEIARDLEPDQ